jgi:hypothetical protein
MSEQESAPDLWHSWHTQNFGLPVHWRVELYEGDRRVGMCGEEDAERIVKAMNEISRPASPDVLKVGSTEPHSEMDGLWPLIDRYTKLFLILRELGYTTEWDNEKKDFRLNARAPLAGGESGEMR